MTQPTTASFMRDASTPDALTRARRRLLANSAGIAVGQMLSGDQLCELADPDWTPPVIENIDTHVIECADPILRALLSESLSDTLARLLALERPHGSYDDTPDGHEAFTRTVLEDYEHGNQYLARATLRPAQTDRVVLLGLECLGIPADALTIMGELARASNPADAINRALADAAFLDLDRYASGQGLPYSRVASTLVLAAPTEERLGEAIDAVAGAAVTLGVRICDLATQHVDADAILASIGIDQVPPI